MSKSEQGDQASPSELILHGPYARLAGIGAVYELRLRMLAEMRERTCHAMHEEAKTVEEAIIAEYRLADEDAGRLKTTRQLRNKVLHGAFREAKEKLKDLDIVVPAGGVHVVALSGPDAGQSEELAADGGTDSIVGWLFECQSSGFFELAARAFSRSIEVLDRLRGQASEDQGA